jgi:hypothetical protein
MPNDERPTVAVELVDEETIVDHGIRKVVWYVRVGDAWVHPRERADCTDEPRDAGPGTVWERASILSLSVGSEVMRVETRPEPRRHTDPLAYLRAETRDVRRRTRRSYYRVTARGGLRPA